MHTSGLGYGPGAITPGVPLVARSAEDFKDKSGAILHDFRPMLKSMHGNYTSNNLTDVFHIVWTTCVGEALQRYIRQAGDRP